ncbi:MAG TPA: apolipoprotein N-acyltransferase [Myxococcota bacterium]|nr:apolipoprotein N-acyltransferase [Myxococcota bacterium]
MTRARQAALVAAGVALQVAAFPPFGVWPCALAALAPLAALCEGARPGRALFLGWLHTAAAGVLVARWLLVALVGEYRLHPAPAAAVLVLTVGAYALVPGAATALYAALRRRTALAAAPLLFGGLFELGEWLRAEPLALPWALIAHPLAPAPQLLQTAALGGAYAPGLAVAATGAGLGLALSHRRALPLVAPALLWALALGYAALGGTGSTGDAALRVGIVQAAVPQRERFQAGSALRNTLHHAQLTDRLAAQAGPLDLVVWSETAVDEDLARAPDLGELLRRTAAAAGAPIVTGAPRTTSRGLENAVVLVDRGGVRDVYAKQALVPFAEYDPPLLGLMAPLLGPVTAGTPYAPGVDARPLAGPLPLATPVCFEITMPGLMRRFRAAGAELVVNLSNDAWFGRSGYPEAHLQHAVLRAIELRSFVVRGTNTGISAVIDPAGRVRARLGVFEEGTLVDDVRAAGPPPPYALLGNGPVLLLLAACAAAPAWRRGRGSSPAPAVRGRR